MGNFSADLDAYIAKSADFARPILTKIRELFHQACPEIEETIKWGCPHFEYKGVLGSMAAFKQHVRFGFWKGTLLKSRLKMFTRMGKTAMNGAQLTDVSELPPDQILLRYMREAVLLNEEGIKMPASKKRARKAEMEIPEYFLAALAKNAKARATFEAFSASHKREYVDWISEAKQEETRLSRLATAIEWMAEGKPRNWKYIAKR